jgi:hypothetical protein
MFKMLPFNRSTSAAEKFQLLQVLYSTKSLNLRLQRYPSGELSYKYLRVWKVLVWESGASKEFKPLVHCN